MNDDDLANKSPKEQYQAAEQFWDDKDTDNNQAFALKWFVKSAERGYAPAEFKLGQIYEDGLIIKKNPFLAAKWYRAAAEHGYAEAQYKLALCYEYGRGVKCDKSAADYWRSVAAENGYE